MELLKFDGEFANDYSNKEIEINVVEKGGRKKIPIEMKLKMQTCEPPHSNPRKPFIIKRRKSEDANIPLLAVPVWDDPFKSGDPLSPLHSVFAESYNVETRQFSCINSWGKCQPHPMISDTEVTRVDLINADVEFVKPSSALHLIPSDSESVSQVASGVFKYFVFVLILYTFLNISLAK